MMARRWRTSSSRTIGRGGRVIIPAFAIGRVEEVIYWLKKLEEAGRIPAVPVFLDSPMALKALQHYTEHADELDPDVRPGRGQVSAFMTKRFQAITSDRQSSELTASRVPSIIISSSGMATGGRLLRHLKVDAAGREEHGAVLGLPGRGHARPATCWRARAKSRSTASW